MDYIPYLKEINELIVHGSSKEYESQKIIFLYDDDATMLTTEYKTGKDKKWINFEHNECSKIARKCRDFADLTRKTDPWTKLTLVIKADGTYEHEFGYGDPKIFEPSTHW